MKFQLEGLQLYKNRDSGTGVFCHFCKNFKNTYFVEHLRTAASEKQQMNYRFNIKNGVIENPFLIIYTKNNKQSVVTKVCSRSTE